MTKHIIVTILLILLTLSLCIAVGCDMFAERSCGIHDYDHRYGEVVVVVAPTCTEGGIGKKVCSVCGKEKTNIALTAAGHCFGDWQTITPSTCTQDGLSEQVCSACGTKNQRTVAKISHNMSEPQIVDTPTCTAEGMSIKRCANCDYTETITLPKIAHNYVETARTDPTCTEQGNIQTTCDGCGDVQNTTLDNLGHTYGDRPQYVYDYLDNADPTLCYKQYRKCIRCNQNIFYKTQSHNFTKDNDRSVEATCVETGIAAQKCSRCNYLPETQIAPIDPTKHIRITEKTEPVDETTCTQLHYGQCDGCDTVTWRMNEASHDFDSATFVCKRKACNAVNSAKIAWFDYSMYNFGLAIKSVKKQYVSQFCQHVEKNEGRIRLPEEGRYTVSGKEQTANVVVMASNLFANLDEQTAALIKYVYVPEGYLRIDENAFANLPSLAEIYLPSSVSEMQPRALKGCSAVTRLTLPHVFHTRLADIFGIIGSVTNDSALVTLNLHTPKIPDDLTIALYSSGHASFTKLANVNLLKSTLGNIKYTLDDNTFTHSQTIYRNGKDKTDGVITYALVDRLVVGKD